ncbi:MAG: TonB-dependent receptor [Bacteroidota bacterium]
MTTKKKIQIILVLQLIGLCCYAQTASIAGKVVDGKDLTPLVGAHILLKNTAATQTTISDVEGAFRFENVATGRYTLEVSYIGYQTISRTVQLEGKDLQLGRLKIAEGVELQEVEVVEKVVPIIQLGDTTQFNADAYKTLPDADAIDLIEKMPTVVVDEGTVQAQGEDVKQVLVDGKPFFGNDPMAALQNLPAEVIDKIQVYDQQSDQAQFTGFDDGETSKTINIITKPDMRNGQFGKIYAGYGSEDRYQGGGNINIFNGDQRISFIGLSNNINQQNFSTEDLLGVVGTAERGRGGRRGGRGRGGPGRRQQGISANDFLVAQQGGITASDALGINFSDNWGNKLNVAASYFFNQSDNTSEQILSQQFFDEEGLTDLYLEESLSQSTNVNHRFSGIFDYKINKYNSLILRTTATWQGNDGQEDVFGQTLSDTDVLNQTESHFSADLTALNVNNALLWRHQFEKRGRTFSIKVSNGFAPKDGESYLLSDNLFDKTSTSLDQFSTLDNTQWNVATDIRYTEPLTRRNQLMFDYRMSYQREESTKETFDFDETTQEYDVFNEDLSIIFSNDYLSHTLGGGYRFKSGDWRLMTRASIQWAELLTEQRLPYEAETDNNFFNVLPMAMLSYRPSKLVHLRLRYRTSTGLPSIEQLQNVVDNSNPLQLTAGNPGLVQSYQHNLRGNYSKTNTEKSTLFYAMINGTFAHNYIASSTYFSASDYDASLEENAQITIPVNMDGYYDIRSFLTYGFPVSPIKSNLNIDLTANYTRTPGLIDEERNDANSSTAGIGLTLASNVSDRVDFTVSSRSNFNTVSNTLNAASNTNYFNQRTKLKLNLILGKGLVLRTDLIHDFYNGFSDDFDQNYLLWNISVGKKLFKDNRGEISLRVFDLLEQNNTLTRNITEFYTEDIQTNVLQQYVMLSFRYDVRHFRAKRG